MARTIAGAGVFPLISLSYFYGVGLLTGPSSGGLVESAKARGMKPVRNPHSDWIFQATGTRSCADCHDMGGARRGNVPVLDNAAVRNLIALGKGAHRGRFADCFRCHPGGTRRGKQ